MKQRWQQYLVYHIPVSEILGEKKCNTDLWKHGIRLGKKEFTFQELNQMRHYPKGHAWEGQFESSTFRTDLIYLAFFGKMINVSCPHKSPSAVTDICFGELVIDFLYQLPYAEETDSCEDPMNMWIRVTVDPKNVAKFENALNKYLDTIAKMELFELPDKEQ